MKYKNQIYAFSIGLLLGELLLLCSSLLNHSYAETLTPVASTSETTVKTAYLTFDDGPSPNTGEILDLLAVYDIKATFFVLQPANTDYDQYLLRAATEGHSIGVHTSSHNYEEIYSSVASYIEDFQNACEYIFQITGSTPSFFRFPGGSINAYNTDISDELIQTMEGMGYTYYDWNVDSQDSNPSTSSSSIYTNVVTGVAGLDTAMILFHDSLTSEHTIEVLEDIIIFLQQEGYVFQAIDETTEEIHFNW